MAASSNFPRVTVLKLGGSLITHKDRPRSINRHALNLLAAAISSANDMSGNATRLILVHGGGSFGHYYAKKFHISQRQSHVSSMGIAQTCQSMLELHVAVGETLLKKKVGIKTILPSELLSTDLSCLSAEGISHIKDSFECGLFPITFGYVLLNHGEAFIISGDDICKAIVNSIDVDKVIFAMDVDGIYPDSSLKGKIVQRLSSTDRVRTGSRFYDVTGGIGSKLRLGFELRRSGVQVFYVNGNKPERLRNLILGKHEERATQITD